MKVRVHIQPEDYETFLKGDLVTIMENADIEIEATEDELEIRKKPGAGTRYQVRLKPRGKLPS